MAATPTLISPPAVPASLGLGEREFATLYAAAEFAASFGLWCDTSLTLDWRLLGVEDNVPCAFAALQKCLHAWLAHRHLPAAWLYVHEYSGKIGLHTHLHLYVPGVPAEESLRSLFKAETAPDWRGELRAWARGWAARQFGRPAPRALRVRGPRQETPWLHWLGFSYLLKGYDCGAIVQSARTSPDGRAIHLGDLIAWPWRESEPVSLRPRAGTSRSLGPERRALGVPGGCEYLLGQRTCRLFPDSAPVTFVNNPRPPFRSTYEDGHRDARRLYPPDFYDRITRLPRVPMPEPDESAAG